ncbi:MAG: hypothetical protein KCHDKBKB_00261 [Elusimicrobia bacterium]|nr:hypothetical protein [Elusimicrobiota bacterium]
MRGRTFPSWLLASLLLTASLVYGQSNLEKENLTLIVEGLIPNTGVLRVALFQSADGYPGNTKKAFSICRATVTATSETITFENIPLGPYAISVYQDLNNDHRLNKSLIGIPKEPVGFSNDPSMRRGQPPFEDTVFLFNNRMKKIVIHMRTR